MTTLDVSNGHIDSLISYVLDVKPYHTKLSEVVEEYLFEDSISVKIVAESMNSLGVLGLDYKQASSNPLLSVWKQSPLRPQSSLSADKMLISDGVRATFQVAPILVNKLFSESSSDTHTVSTDDVSDVPGNPLGIISQRNFAGPGPAFVKVNDTYQLEGLDYYQCLGAFSFDTIVPNGVWKRSDVPNATENDGSLVYAEVKRANGWIINVSSTVITDLEEWTLTWDSTSSWLVVSGSISGVIGHASVDVPFTSSKINFTFTRQASEGGAAGDLPAQIKNGDIFHLTPQAKISLGSNAINETWTIFKINPVAVYAQPVFVSSTVKHPFLNLFSRDLERAPTGDYTITFTSDSQFQISCSVPIDGYPKTGAVDQSFKDDYLHFSILRNGSTFAAGDHFTFSVLPRKHFAVYGSISGWQGLAAIDTWYWNGRIGFKIPPLDYFACLDNNTENVLRGDQFIPLLPPHSVMQPSVYTIKFNGAISYQTNGASASVQNNAIGFRPGLETNVDWDDGFCSWKINNVDPSHTVNVYLCEKSVRTFLLGYDEAPYDTIPFDIGNGDVSFPKNLLQEYFPFYHSFGCIILPQAQADDEVIFEKIERDHVRLKIDAPDPSTIAPLGADDGWVPLEFRYLDSNDNAVAFPDYVSKVSAYLAANPTVKAFEIRQPLNQLAVLEFDEQFLSTFLPTTTPFTLRFHQNSTWAQAIHVKVSEDILIDFVPVSSAISLENPTASVNDNSLFIYQRDPSSHNVQVVNTMYSPSLNGVDGLHINSNALNYVITLTEPFQILSVHIVPDVGSEFDVDISKFTYPPIPTAVSLMSFSFSVPAGTGPFTMFATGTPPPGSLIFTSTDASNSMTFNQSSGS